MKNLAFALGTLFLLTFGCKKENPPVVDANLLHLTFTGTVVNQLTQEPIANVPVHVIYGTKCCGDIVDVKGGDSTFTNAAGEYTLKISYSKPAEAYRHFTYVPGAFKFHYANPIAFKQRADWFTIGPDESAVLPFDLADTVKIVDGYVSTAKIDILPAATLGLQFPYTIVPATDSVKINWGTSPEQGTHYGLFFLPGKSIYQQGPILEFYTLAAQKTYIFIDVYNPGTDVIRKAVIDSFTLNQSQLYQYQVNY